jgi:hypothetical protein
MVNQAVLQVVDSSFGFLVWLHKLVVTIDSSIAAQTLSASLAM